MSLLVETTVRMSLIVLAAVIAALALRRHSAALRHWVLAVGIACGAAMPLLHLVLPSWDVAGVFASATQPRPARVTTEVVVSGPAAAALRTPPAQPATGVAETWPLATVLISAWLTGAAASLLMLVAGLSRVSRIASAARPLRGPLAVMASDIKGAMGLRRAVTLLQSRDATALMTWGAARPTIVLPAGAQSWSDDRARVVLRHEIAHVARNDWLAQMVAETLRAVYWFNPLVWIACRRLRVESERACDDAVLSAGVNPADYASHLLELARTAARSGRSPALAMARSSSLEGRVSAMLNDRTDRRPLRNATRIATFVALVAIAVPIAGAQGRFSTFSGTVLDQTSRLVPEATLVLTDEASGAKHEVRSDRAGHFEFVGLPSGDYGLAVQKPGFQVFKDTITVAGKDEVRTVQLQIGSVHETVRVANETAEPAPNGPEQRAALERSRQHAQDAHRRVSEACGGGATGEIGGQILPPVKLTHVRPAYPDPLKTAGISGTVTLDALIGVDGTVRDVKGVSSPHPDLTRAAADAVQQWAFTTTYLNCTPVEVPMRVTVTFVSQ